MAEPTIRIPLPSALTEPSGGPPRGSRGAHGSDEVTALNPLDHPVCLSPPRRLSPAASWHEHLSFAMFLIDLARPAVLAELGYLPHLAREREVVKSSGRGLRHACDLGCGPRGHGVTS